MNWQVWQWTFELESPLHVGFHKIMHLYRTRPYLPGKNLWAAITARLTQLLGASDYTRIGGQIHRYIRFGYLFPCEGDRVLFPNLTEKGWRHGEMNAAAFERRYFRVIASTAIESATLTAEDESLHEVEVLSPWQQEVSPPQKTRLTGVFWVRTGDDTRSDFGVQLDESGILILAGSHRWHIEDVVEKLQVGGERRYGFGRLTPKGRVEKIKDGLGAFPGRTPAEAQDFPKIELDAGKHVWAHVEVEGSDCKGDIEAVVGREWDTQRGAGRELSSGKLYWLPGSILKRRLTFNVDATGLWKSV